MPYLSTDPRPVSATIAASIRENQTRLIHRANPPDARPWKFPSGKLDHGVSLFQDAPRELTKDNALAARQINLNARNKTSLTPSLNEAEIANQAAALLSEVPS